MASGSHPQNVDGQSIRQSSGHLRKSSGHIGQSSGHIRQAYGQIRQSSVHIRQSDGGESCLGRREEGGVWVPSLGGNMLQLFLILRLIRFDSAQSSLNGGEGQLERSSV